MRTKVIRQAQAWLGRREADGSHKEIIDVYNAHRPLPRGYRVGYDDAWCATFVSAVAIRAGVTEILPVECGCGEMLRRFQDLEAWVEEDTYVPRSGDVIFYDWQAPAGESTGWPDHVGLVEGVENGEITLIEGNYGNAVQRRRIPVGSREIRGFGVPHYRELPAATPPEVPGEPTPTPPEASQPEESPKIDPAGEFDPALAGPYTVTAHFLNIRQGAGMDKPILWVLPQGTQVRNYGYCTTREGRRWLYIQFTQNHRVCTGFASARYLAAGIPGK